jgi:uncharacterized protein
MEAREAALERARAPHRADHAWLSHAIAHAAHYLPAQAPLEVFVHHNTLHAFQHMPFHDAVAAAGEKLGARGYLTEELFRAAFAGGRISEDDLDAVIEQHLRAPPTAVAGVAGVAAAARPDRAMLKIALLHDLDPETPAGLIWRLAEHGAARRFHKELPAGTAARLASETVAWLRRELDGDTQGGAERLFADPTGEPGPLRHAFGRAPDRQRLGAWLEEDPEAIAVGCLWQACRWLTFELRAGASEGAGREPVEDPQTSAGGDARAPFRFHRELLLAIGDEDPNEQVHPLLVLLAGAFLDLGQSQWSMPDRGAGFFVAFCRVLTAGRAVRPSWLESLGRRLRGWVARGTDAAEAIGELLGELGIEDAERGAFVERTLLHLPGWAGMFHRVESAPSPPSRDAARVTLLDFLAVRLTLDALAIEDLGSRLGYRGPLAGLRAYLAARPPISAPPPSGDHDMAWPLFLLSQFGGLSAGEVLAAGTGGAKARLAMLEALRAGQGSTRLRLWHEAYERRYREQLLEAIAANRGRLPSRPAPRFQTIFCIDDRVESLRRHIEEGSAAHATYGTAGFFNLAIAYQGIDDPSTFPLCPVVVRPQHRIEEEPWSEHAHLAEARVWRRRRMGAAAGVFHRASRSLVWGPVVTALAGFASALPLLASLFAPWLAGKLRREARRRLLPAPRTRLTLPRVGEEGDGAGELLAGFSLEEKVTRVATLLENVGLVRDFAPLVALVGHDASSVNNPHFAAYSCGACGGRSGGPNARLFARMANRPEVRAGLRERGIHIPEETSFVGGVHDTTRDSVELHDVDDLPAGNQLALRALRAELDRACAHNAHERARRFASAPRGPTPRQALRHVEARSMDLSQARPELGHATNAACIVGRRELTRGLFLDRRAFLVSYDPRVDPSGAILERTLLAVGPVGAGINLEYFFSSTDNERYGAGTKLPHNVTGLIGVMNGASSDLRTGLPRQMIEIHEPIRLHLLIEASAGVLAAIVARQPSLRELVDNEWVRVMIVDPETGDLMTYQVGHGFEAWRPAAGQVGAPPHAVSSAAWYAGKDDFLVPALLSPDAEERSHES